jgi:hypothetical protein
MLLLTFEIAIASSSPGGGESSNSPNFNSPSCIIKDGNQRTELEEIHAIHINEHNNGRIYVNH